MGQDMIKRQSKILRRSIEEQHRRSMLRNHRRLLMIKTRHLIKEQSFIVRSTLTRRLMRCYPRRSLNK